MTSDKDQSTEAKIRQAARKIFLHKGFEGTKTRDIAQEAGVNLALVNYYFRSKEKLFREVFEESFFAVSRTIATISNEDLPVEQKIAKLVNGFAELFLKEPDMPLFVVSEMQRQAEEMYDIMGLLPVVRSGVFGKQLEEEAEKGNIRPITRFEVELICAALIMFPFMARPILAINGITGEEAFEQFIRKMQKMIPEMVMTYLRKE